MTIRLRWRAVMGWLCLAVALALAGAALAAKAPKQAPRPPGPYHVPLASDGVHDPANPGIALLQEPQDALAKLPPDTVGAQVRWVQALQYGAINPRTNILPDTPIRVLNLDVVMPRTGEMPMVVFPHQQHTEWLDCNNCHEHLFKYKAGATTKVNMFEVLQGEYCGLCHGAVSFPLTECRRCHSKVRE
jgi:c(7)-type cytochrome triheme protein